MVIKESFSIAKAFEEQHIVMWRLRYSRGEITKYWLSVLSQPTGFPIEGFSGECTRDFLFFLVVILLNKPVIVPIVL